MTVYTEKNSFTLVTGASDPEGDPITVRRVNGIVPSGWPHVVPLSSGNVSISENGVVVYDDGGVVSGHPSDGQSQTNGSFTFTLWDGNLESTTLTATIELEGITPVTGTQPVLNRLIDQTAVVGQAFFFNPTTDFNVPGLSGFSAADLPQGLSIDAATGIISGTPTLGGEHKTVVVSATAAGQTYTTSLAMHTQGGEWQAWGPDAGYVGPGSGTVHVDGSVSASGNGSSWAQAFKTIQEGVTAMADGVGGTIVVAGGTYPERVSMKNGAPGNRLRLVPRGSDEVIVTGAEPLTGLTRCASPSQAGGNGNFAEIFTTTIPESALDFTNGAPGGSKRYVTRMLGANIHEAGQICPPVVNRATGLSDREQFELFFWPYMYHAPGGFSQNGTTEQVTAAALQGLNQAAMQNYAFILCRTSPNVTNMAKVQSFDPATGTASWGPGDWKLGGSQPYWSNASKHHFAVVNNPLDLQPGRWAFDPSTILGDGTGQIRIWIWPRDEANLGAFTYSRREQCISVAGKSHVEIEGLTMEMAGGEDDHAGGGVTDDSGSAHISDIVVRNCTIRKMYNSGDKGLGTVFFRRADDVIVEKNRIQQIGGTLNIINLNGDTANGSNAVPEYKQGNYGRFCSNSVIRKNDMDLLSRNPFTGYGAIDMWIMDNRISRLSGAHANIVTLYNSCVRPVVMRNWFTDCSGYISTQDNSNIFIFGNVFDWRNFATVLNDNRVINNDGAEYSVEDGGYHHIFNNLILYDDANQATKHDVRIGIQKPRPVIGSVSAGGEWRWTFTRNICAERVIGSANEEARVESSHNVYMGVQTVLGAGELQSSTAGVFGGGQSGKSAGYLPASGGAASVTPGASNAQLPAIPAGVSALSAAIDMTVDIRGQSINWTSRIGPVDF